MTSGEFQSRHSEILQSFPELKKEKPWSRDGAGMVGEQGWRRPLEEIDPGAIVGLGLVGEVEDGGEIEAGMEVPLPPSSTREGTDAGTAEAPGGIVAEESVGYSAGEGKPEQHPSYSLEECAAETGIDEVRLKEWIGAIERKGGGTIGDDHRRDQPRRSPPRIRQYHRPAATGFDIGPLLELLERLNREIENRHYQRRTLSLGKSSDLNPRPIRPGTTTLCSFVSFVSLW